MLFSTAAYSANNLSWIFKIRTYISFPESVLKKLSQSKICRLKRNDTESLAIISDKMARFASGEGMRAGAVNTKFRVIAGKSKKDNKTISFITNVNFLTACEIAELYKSRWEIETFFKFIKQELNFKHLLSRTENGIKVVMYLTMIAAILLTVYKKVNNIIGWAAAKIYFMDELESGIMREWHSEMNPVFNVNNPFAFNSS